MNEQIVKWLTRIFNKHLPDSLYMSPDELANLLDHDNQSPKEWKRFLELPDIQRLIEREIARDMEILARKSLRKLGQSNELNSNDINAIKEILNKSKLIQEKSQSKETVILTYLPSRQAKATVPPSPSNVVSSQPTTRGFSSDQELLENSHIRKERPF